MTTYRAPEIAGYDQLVARLQRISLDCEIAPDMRRLAVDAYQRMIAAAIPPWRLDSDASYSNRYGLETGMAQREQDIQALRDDTRRAMEQAMQRATQFLSAWTA